MVRMMRVMGLGFETSLAVVMAHKQICPHGKERGDGSDFSTDKEESEGEGGRKNNNKKFIV